jgi:TolA-binding protein/TM2 domain-containing membrane protein YozV
MVWLVVLLAGIRVAGAAGTGESAPVMAFADDLYRRGDYYRAITEYERFIFLNPQADAVARARVQVGMCYYRGGKWEAARDEFLHAKEQYGSRPEGREAWLMLAKTHYRMEKYTTAEALLEEYIRSFPDDEHSGDAHVMKGICLARFGNTQWARDSFSRIPTNSVRRADVESLDNLTDRLETVARKSPALAGSLSAVIPGAGQLYVERPRDATVSFLINGVTIAGMLAAFHNHEEVVGCLFGVLESSWYFGNIYNASMGARKYNTRRREALFDQLEVNCGLLKDSPTGNLLPGLGVRVRF